MILASLAVVSLISAVGMLWIFRMTSDQARLAAVKRLLQACVYEIRLFQDDPRAMWRAVGEMFRHNLTYLRLSIVPMVWIAAPLGLVLVQLQFHYGYDGLHPGRPAVIKAHMTSPASGARPLLTAPEGIRIETPAVLIPTLGEAAWRIVAERPGDYALGVTVDGQVFTKVVRVSNDLGARSPVRHGSGLINRLLLPPEALLPSGAAVDSISVAYPSRYLRVLGFDVHWTIGFFVMSLAFALALRRRMNVVV